MTHFFQILTQTLSKELCIWVHHLLAYLRELKGQNGGVGDFHPSPPPLDFSRNWLVANWVERLWISENITHNFRGRIWGRQNYISDSPNHIYYALDIRIFLLASLNYIHALPHLCERSPLPLLNYFERVEYWWGKILVKETELLRVKCTLEKWTFDYEIKWKKSQGKKYWPPLTIYIIAYRFLSKAS